MTDAKTALLEVGDRRIDFQGLADRLAALRTQVVVVEAKKNEAIIGAMIDVWAVKALMSSYYHPALMRCKQGVCELT